MFYINPDSIADDQALSEIKKQHVVDMFADLYGEFTGKEDFTCRVLSKGPDGDAQQQVGVHSIIKYRSPMHEGCIPSPCDPLYSSPKEVKRLISLHPSAASLRPSGVEDRTPRFGQPVVLKFLSDGPNNRGRMRQPRFDYNRDPKKDNFPYECAAAELAGAAKFDVSNAVTISQVIPPQTDAPLNQTATPDQLISSITKDDTVLLFGDSQMQGNTKGGDTIGKTLQNSFKKGRSSEQAKKVIREGNHGWKPSDYVSNFDFKLKPHLEKKPKLIIIVLGGNGVHPTGRHALTLIEKIRAITSKSEIIWIGPPPPAKDGSTYNKDGKLLSTRKKTNDLLEKYVGPKVSKFINSYSVGNFGQGYNCEGKCDGVHMPGSHAKNFLNEAGMLKA